MLYAIYKDKLLFAVEETGVVFVNRPNSASAQSNGRHNKEQYIGKDQDSHRSVQERIKRSRSYIISDV